MKIDTERIQNLPINGQLDTNQTGIVIEEINEEQMNLECSELKTEDNIMQEGSSSFFPSDIPSKNENEKIIDEIEIREGTNDVPRFDWPKIGDNPINEFETPGYMSLAFPTLFPTGTAQFRAARMRPITIGNYFLHLTKYKDGRFAKHPRFRYFALNTELRWRSL